MPNSPAVRGEQAIVARVRTPEFREQLRMALPENVSLARFERATITALMQDDKLTGATQKSLFQAIIKCAQDGLMPDGREAAITVFGKDATYMPMVGGFRKIAAEYGWTIRSAVVYEGDEFDYELGLSTRLSHRPAKIGEARGKMVAAYAVGVHRDGRSEFEVMPADEIEKVRQASKAKNAGPWVQWPERMWEKTPVRRLFKKLALDPSDKRVASLAASQDPVAELYGSGAYSFDDGNVSAEPPALTEGSTAGDVAEDVAYEAPSGSTSPAAGPDFGSSDDSLLAQVHAGIDRLAPTMGGWRLEKVLQDAERAFGRPIGALTDLTDDELAQILRAMPGDES